MSIMGENQNMEEPKEKPRSLSCKKCNYQMDEFDDLNLYVYRTNMAPLLSHICRIHFGYQPYLCSHCPAVFPTLTEIVHHIELCHDGNFKITSRRDADVERHADEDLCRILAGNGDMMQDQEQNSQAAARKNGLFCSECNYGLEHSKTEDARIELMKMDPLVCHVRRFHFGYLPFKCGHCPGVFPTLLDIERHVEYAHKGEWKVSSNRNHDIESDVKQMLVTDHQMPGHVFSIINNDADAPRPPVRSNDSDNTDHGRDEIADKELNLQPVMLLERCLSVPPSVHNFQVMGPNEESPVRFPGLSKLTSSDRSRGSRPRVGKYKEFIQILSKRGLPKMPARPKRPTSARQDAILSRNVQSSHQENQSKPSSTALTTCFDDDFDGVIMIQNRTILMKCPKCQKICKPHGIVTHLRHSHKLDQEERKEFFANCKICGASVYRQVALIHANACKKLRGNCNRQKKKKSLGRSFRSDSRINSTIVENGTEASTSHQKTPPTRRVKKELNLGYDDEDMSSEYGDDSYWNFTNQD